MMPLYYKVLFRMTLITLSSIGAMYGSISINAALISILNIDPLPILSVIYDAYYQSQILIRDAIEPLNKIINQQINRFGITIYINQITITWIGIFTAFIFSVGSAFYLYAANWKDFLLVFLLQIISAVYLYIIVFSFTGIQIESRIGLIAFFVSYILIFPLFLSLYISFVESIFSMLKQVTIISMNRALIRECERTKNGRDYCTKENIEHAKSYCDYNEIPGPVRTYLKSLLSVTPIIFKISAMYVSILIICTALIFVISISFESQEFINAFNRYIGWPAFFMIAYLLVYGFPMALFESKILLSKEIVIVYIIVVIFVPILLIFVNIFPNIF